jgi:hypothetical protein
VQAQPASSATPAWAAIGAHGCVLLAGGLCLAMPFFPDQALFTIYAQEIARGTVLYRDLFDIKQPGIYGFYALAGWLFGFNEIGIHLFELLYWIVFSILVSRVFRPYFLTSWGSALIPVFTVGVYYLWAGLPDLTQIEILVAFPLLLLWRVLDGADTRSSEAIVAYATAGLLAAVVVLLKYLYLIVALALLIVIVRRECRRGVPPARIHRSLLGFGVALAIPLLIVAGYFAAHGQLERIWWIYFQYVPGSQLLGTKSFAFLKFGFRRFLVGHGPIVVLATFGLFASIYAADQTRRRLVAAMALWCVTGLVAVGVQGWWEYKWEFFTMPLGVVAAVGVETISVAVGSVPGRTRLVAGASVAGIAMIAVGAAGAPHVQTWLLVSVPLGICAAAAGGVRSDARGRPGRFMLLLSALCLGVAAGIAGAAPLAKFRSLAIHGFGIRGDARQQYQRSLSQAYLAADSDLAVLRRRNAEPHSLHVFGDPVLLFRAGLPPATPFLGQAPDSYDSRAWHELDRALRAANPAYVVIDAYSEPIIRSRYPAVVEWIESRYSVALEGSAGTWYARRALGGSEQIRHPQSSALPTP